MYSIINNNSATILCEEEKYFS